MFLVIDNTWDLFSVMPTLFQSVINGLVSSLEATVEPVLSRHPWDTRLIQEVSSKHVLIYTVQCAIIIINPFVMQHNMV